MAGTRYESSVTPFWTPAAKVRTWAEVELCALKFWDPEAGTSANGCFAANGVRDHYPWSHLASEVSRWELQFGHEIEALVFLLHKEYKTGLWHKGLASSDLVDCAIAVAIKKSVIELHKRRAEVVALLVAMAHRHKDVLESGLTHGMPAEPFTWGVRFSHWADQMSVATLRGFPGKVSGAVGTGVVTPPGIAKLVSAELGIEVLPPHGMQIVPRAQLIDALSGLLVMAVSAEKICNDMRLLFAAGRISFVSPTVASSSMPHKRNPSLMERCVGICGMVRSDVLQIAAVAAQNWMERDLTNSVVERELLGHAYSHMAYVLETMAAVIPSMEIFPREIGTSLLSSLRLVNSQTSESDRVSLRKLSVHEDDDDSALLEAVRTASLDVIASNCTRATGRSVGAVGGT